MVNGLAFISLICLFTEFPLTRIFFSTSIDFSILRCFFYSLKSSLYETLPLLLSIDSHQCISNSAVLRPVYT
jgi:hypothetical protein